MRRIILVRHGEAENNLHNLIGGWSDVKLTELGQKQAQAVAERLHDELKEEYSLYSSDLSRARETTEIISARLGIDPVYALELREHNPGVVSGMPWEEAKSYFHDVPVPSLKWRPYPESESWGEFYERVEGYMERLAVDEEQVIIVSHGGTIQNIINWWMETPISGLYKVAFDIRNASVSVLDWSDRGEKRLERLNDTSHYRLIGEHNSIDLG